MELTCKYFLSGLHFILMEIPCINHPKHTKKPTTKEKQYYVRVIIQGKTYKMPIDV